MFCWILFCLLILLCLTFWFIYFNHFCGRGSRTWGCTWEVRLDCTLLSRSLNPFLSHHLHNHHIFPYCSVSCPTSHPMACFCSSPLKFIILLIANSLSLFLPHPDHPHPHPSLFIYSPFLPSHLLAAIDVHNCYILNCFFLMVYGLCFFWGQRSRSSDEQALNGR